MRAYVPIEKVAECVYAPDHRSECGDRRLGLLAWMEEFGGRLEV